MERVKAHASSCNLRTDLILPKKSTNPQALCDTLCGCSCRRFRRALVLPFPTKPKHTHITYLYWEFSGKPGRESFETDAASSPVWAPGKWSTGKARIPVSCINGGREQKNLRRPIARLRARRTSQKPEAPPPPQVCKRKLRARDTSTPKATETFVRTSSPGRRERTRLAPARSPHKPISISHSWN